MTEPYSFEDDAELYVLGRLEPDQRREFEERLKNSTELQSRVRELQEGLVALAMATPQRKTPPQVWRQIEKAIAGEAGRNKVVYPIWFSRARNVLAAAACLMCGWLLHVLWLHREGPSASRGGLAALNEPAGRVRPDDSGRVVLVRPVLTDPWEVTNVLYPPSPPKSPVQTGEIALLHRQIGNLTDQVNQMAQVMTQQQALLTDPNRLAFYQLGSPNSTGGMRAIVAPSPELQRVLFFAMARELGWQPPDGGGITATSSKSADTGQSSTSAGHDAIEYVYLSSSGAAQSQSTSTQPANNEPTSGTDQSAPARASGETGMDTSNASAAPTNSTAPIPFFLSGTNATFAFNASVVPPGASGLTFWTSDANGNYASLGTIPFGGNPLAVTVPIAYPWTGGQIIFVSTSSVPGSMNGVLGQFQLPAQAPAQP
jgi:hypothetical protein